VLANYTPVEEDVLPNYYFMPTPDPAHPNKPTDSCNPNGEEDYAGSPLGLDNDGNGLYDSNDPVCVCGNGIIDPAEDCDDGNAVDGDCCSATCQFEPEGSPCPDGEFCNGDETCDGGGTCLAGTPVDCSDGVGCTDDSCDEADDVCVNDPNDLNCPDDGLFCNGDEFCDAVSDCSFTGDPCEAGTICDDATDTCEPLEGCGDGIIEPPGEECDDSNILDGDCCSALCQFEPAGSPCPDGAFCNGDETCNGAGTCEAVPVDCSDGVDCTVDWCNEATDSCDNTPDDGLCDNALFCDGIEVCDPVNDCSTTGDPCADGTVCNEESETCDTEGGSGGCQLQPPGSGRSGMSNGGSAILILLGLCAVLLRERRRKRAPAAGR
jgi:cysteine-rich repeat protein